MVKQNNYQLPLSDDFQKYLNNHKVEKFGDSYYLDSMRCQPLIYIKDSKRDIFGVIKPINRNGVRKGAFELSAGGNEYLRIMNVCSYAAFVRPDEMCFYERITYNHIAEEKDFHDILVCAIIYSKGEYCLKVYHNWEHIRTIKNTYPKFSIDLYLKKAGIKYSVFDGDKYLNYLYVLDDDKILQLDDSNYKPTFELHYTEPKYKYWTKFYEEMSDKHNTLSVIFHNDGSKPAQILFEYGETADEFKILPNIFNDDLSQNYKITFIDRPEAVYFVNYCARRGKDILGYNLYQIPIYQYRYGIINHPEEGVLVTNYNKSEQEYYKQIANMLFDKCGYSADNRHFLPTEIMNTYICAQTMSTIVRSYIANNFDFNGIDQDLEKKSKQTYDSIYSKLIKSNKISSRWKSESSLFLLIAEYYPDTIYQYKDNWLDKQSLDIFIPSLRVAFEYQGLQHYEVVSLFGGDPELKNRQVLDKQKKVLCRKNKVILIEWKYDEPITQLALKKKLLQNGIVL